VKITKGQLRQIIKEEVEKILETSDQTSDHQKQLDQALYLVLDRELPTGVASTAKALALAYFRDAWKDKGPKRVILRKYIKDHGKEGKDALITALEHEIEIDKGKDKNLKLY
jgi:hypothetical protein